MICVHNVPYALLHIRYIFKKQIRRLPGFSQTGQFKEESAARISESSACPRDTERLARKTAADKLKIWHCAGVCFSCIIYEPLSFSVKQGVIAAIGILVDFAVAHAFKASGTGQSLTEATDAGEHIHELDQGHNSLWGCLPHLRMCLIGAPHQKQKQSVIGCNEQDFFTIHNV